VVDDNEMDDGQEEEELARIKVERAEILTEGNEQIHRCRRVVGGNGIILEGDKDPGNKGNIEADQTPRTPLDSDEMPRQRFQGHTCRPLHKVTI